MSVYCSIADGNIVCMTWKNEAHTMRIIKKGFYGKKKV